MNETTKTEIARSTIVLDVALLPSLVDPESMQGCTVVVVDVLRATTTIVQALHNGCLRVYPQPSIESARACHASQTGPSVLGGERQGRIVDGFHHGNSPLEYTPEVIANKSLVLATTNGTVAMERCRFAQRVLIGAMVNLAAVAGLIEDDPRVTVLCSGTDRCITGEDVLFAGALTERLIENRRAAGKPVGQLTDQASIALHHWKQVRAEGKLGKPLADFFRQSRGGLNLVRIGHDADIAFAAELDSVPVVPWLDLDAWTIEAID